MKILVSACLCGVPCRYDGASKKNEAVMRLTKENEVILFCPERAGGLPVPRVPAERIGDKVINSDGVDVTDAYMRGAALALETAKREKVFFAVLKARSPSCGKEKIYDGTFRGVLCSRSGVTAELLLREGISVYTEEEIEASMQQSGNS